MGEAFRLTPPSWDSPLDARLRYEPGSVADLFPAGPRPTREALSAACAAADRLPIDRKGLAGRLRASHSAWGAPPESLAAVDDLARPGTFLVVAGQQPGILGGPLYTLHKAVGAVLLARAWNATGAARFIPAFWIASDDHDLAEVNAVSSQGADGGPRKWSLPIPDRGEPLHRSALPAEAASGLVRDFLEAAAGEIPEWAAEFEPPTGGTLSAWFARILLSELGKEGLVLIEPSAVLWPDAGDLFPRMLSGWERVRAETEAAAADLARRGFGSPIALPLGTPLFHHGEGRRRRVDAPSAEWAARAAKEPGSFSPDVLGRAACQGALLPVAAQVAGPHEVAYLPLAAPLARFLGGVPCPVIPRPSVTWLDGPSGEFLAGAGLSVQRLIAGVSYDEAVAARVPPEARMNLEGFDEALDSALLRLADWGLSHDPNLAEPLRKGRLRIEEESGRMKRRVTGAVLAGRGLGLARWDHASGWIHPRGRLQERVYGQAAVLARLGRGKVLERALALDPFDFRHQVAAV